MDALSELLRAVKLSGAMFYNAEGSKPWRVDAPPSTTLGRYVAPNASHVIEFHFVTQGTGYIRVGEETTPFAAGDLLMVPHGDAHEMGNGTGAEPLATARRTCRRCCKATSQRSRFGGGGEKTRFDLRLPRVRGRADSPRARGTAARRARAHPKRCAPASGSRARSCTPSSACRQRLPAATSFSRGSPRCCSPRRCSAT